MAGKFHYGGQAIIEGVMIRGRKKVACAVRRPDGSLVVRTEAARSLAQAHPWLRLSFLRGTPALIDSLLMGFRALVYSADVAMEAEGVKPPSRLWYAFTFVVALAAGVLLFVILPSLALQPLAGNSLLMNLLEGLLRLLIFLGYILIVSRSANIRRIFEYHGAEHMVVNAFESGREISPEAAKDFSTIHVRCGSSFIMLVIFIAILVHAVAGWPAWYIRIPLRLLLIVPIAGISYEIMKLAASPRASRLTAVITAPGLWLQRLTTRPPSEEQIAVAIASLQALLQAEEEEESPQAAPAEAPRGR